MRPVSIIFFLTLWPYLFIYLFYFWASLAAQMVKYLPAMQEMCVRFLGQEGPL